MTTDTEYLRETGRLVARLEGLATTDPETKKACRALLDETRKRLRTAEPERCVFDMHSAERFVWMGAPPRPVPHPNRAGVDDAHCILMAGAHAHLVLDASDFGCSPNSLRNRLELAAQWADENGSSTLARVVRSIVVGSDGAITYTPLADVAVVLRHDFD